MGTHDADSLFTQIWPEYFETQAKDLFWYERLWGVLLRQLEKRIDRRWMVEFGSGPGFLIKLAQRRGWMAEGVEPSEVARAHSLGMGAIAWSSIIPLPGYPAAIATEVLEHVEDPTKTLLEWRAALVPGGLLAISVPNDNNPLQRLFGRLLAPRRGDSGGLIQCADRSRPWIHHTHLHYFNPKSLKAVVESCGFEVVWQRTSFPVELLLVVPFLPRKWAWRLSRIWPAPPLLWRLGIGRHCLLIAKKR